MPGKRKVTDIVFGASLDPFSKETRRGVVGPNRGGGVCALDWATREFTGLVRNFAFMSARSVDADRSMLPPSSAQHADGRAPHEIVSGSSGAWST
jgi:hypothetical protein